MKKIVSFILALVLLFSLSACGEQTGSALPEFKDLGEYTADGARVFVSGERAVFSFITSSLYGSTATLVLYDLAADRPLGTLENVDGEDNVFFTETGILLLSHYNKTLTEYDFSLQKKSVRSFDSIKGALAFSGMSDGKIIISSIEDCSTFIFDTETNALTPSEFYSLDAKFLAPNKDGFLLASAEGLSLARFDGKVKDLSFVPWPSVAATSYALGKMGDWLLFHAVGKQEVTMTPANGAEETVCAEGGRFLCRTGNTLYLYDIDKSLRFTLTAENDLLSAGFWGDYVLAVTLKDGRCRAQCIAIEGEGSSFELIDYHLPTINDVTPLPQPGGSAELISEIKKLEEDFGVRVMYEEGFFDFSAAEITLSYATEQEILKKLPVIREELGRFPEGLFFEMCRQAQPVIFLCDGLSPSSGGLNTLLSGYNLTVVSVTGKDDFFRSVLHHELWHALERNMREKTLAAWRETMPDDVLAAYDNPSLTVEYTVDDKGRTDVWFADAYGRSDELEDRATIFSEMLSDNRELFTHAGTRKKAKCLEEMLFDTYESCRGVAFSWNDIYKN